MGNGHVTIIFAVGKLFLLKVGIGQHALFFITEGKVEHPQIKGVKTRQGDKLKSIAHGSKLFLKLGNVGIGQVAFPVK